MNRSMMTTLCLFLLCSACDSKPEERPTAPGRQEPTVAKAPSELKKPGGKRSPETKKALKKALKKESKKKSVLPKMPPSVPVAPRPAYFDWTLQKTATNGRLTVTLRRIAVLPYSQRYLSREPQFERFDDEEKRGVTGSYMAVEFVLRLDGRPIDEDEIKSFQEHVLVDGKSWGTAPEQDLRGRWGRSLARPGWFYAQTRGYKNISKEQTLTYKIRVALNSGEKLELTVGNLKPPASWYILDKNK